MRFCKERKTNENYRLYSDPIHELTDVEDEYCLRDASDLVEVGYQIHELYDFDDKRYSIHTDKFYNDANYEMVQINIERTDEILGIVCVKNREIIRYQCQDGCFDDINRHYLAKKLNATLSNKCEQVEKKKKI